MHFESQFLFSFSSNGKVFLPLHNAFYPVKPSFPTSPSETPLLSQTSVLSYSTRKPTQIPNVITCSRNSRKRTRYQRPAKWVLESLCFVASNLNLLPEPVALAISAFVGGEGGGSGFLKGFGAGGFDGWGRRRRRKGKNKLGFDSFVIICCIGMCLVLGKHFDSDVVLGVLSLSLLRVSIQGWRRGFKDWVLGFCFCASLVVLGFRREKLHSFLDLKKLDSFLDLQKLRSLGKGFGALETALWRRK